MVEILLYYHFAKVDSPESFVDEHREFCISHNLLGRVLISHEGINGTLGGEKKDTDAYQAWLQSKKGFETTWFKIQTLDTNPFPKLQVRARKELVTLRRNIDVSKGGAHLDPSQVNEMVQKYGEDVVFLDARNEIESRIGKFKNAITPHIKTFRELPSELKKIAPQLQHKKVIMYCTGGIRCETASVLLKEAGVEDVYQINGGIYNYCNQYPDGLYEGTCYVFDDRMQVGWNSNGEVVPHDALPQDKIISHCEFCGVKTARVVNDERYLERVQRVCCTDCDAKFDISRLRTKLERQEIRQKSLQHSFLYSAN